VTDLCHDCEWMQRDNDMRARCYSPQLRKLGTPGIIVQFERDSAPEPERSHDTGTGKCGPSAINKQRRIGV
jgi:hypothetical protein